MQSGYRARGNLGYYGEEFFDFGPFEEIRGEVLELGRACVHREYRNSNVPTHALEGNCKIRVELRGALVENQSGRVAQVQVQRHPRGASGAAAAIPRLSGYLGAHLRTSSNRPGIQNYRFPDVGGLASAAGSRANAGFLNTCMASEHRYAICSGGSSVNR